MRISKYFVFTLVICLALLTSGAMAAKLTGGAEDLNIPRLSVSANAVETPKGLKGHIQYSRDLPDGSPDLYLHAAVEGFSYAGEGGLGSESVVMGPLTVQYNSDPSAILPPYIVVFIQEGGTGSGDRVRVLLLTQLQAEAVVADPGSNNNYPGVVLDGNFTLQP